MISYDFLLKKRLRLSIVKNLVYCEGGKQFYTGHIKLIVLLLNNLLNLKI